jgi:Putative Flp pilus-assembly TadE/G-like
MPRHGRSQSGQVMVLVALSLIALIGSAALVLVAGSAEWQKNQLQQVADQAALEAALKIGIGCDAGKATTVIDAAETSIGKQRTPVGGLGPVLGGPCAPGYTATETYSTGALSSTVNYPYQAHQQQVEVVLTLTLPISFGGVVGSASTKVIRRAVAQALPGSVPALSATTLNCTGGQVNVAGSFIAQAVTLSNNCALYAHNRFDVTSSTYSDLGNASVYADNQMWIGGAGSCSPIPTNAICADGYELSGHVTPTCGTTSAFLSVGDAAVNPNPCAPGVARPPVPPVSVSTSLPPEPNTDPTAIAQLVGTVGAACTPLGTPPPISVKGKVVGTSFATPPTIPDAKGFYHFKPSCYGYLDPSSLSVGGGGITNKQTGPEVGPATSTLKVTLSGASTVGTLLVVVLRSDTNPSDKPFAPNPVAGWISAIPGGAFVDGVAHTEIWYYPNNPGAIAQWNFDVSPNSIAAVGQMTEWSGVAVSALDASGTFLAAANQTSVTVKTSTATTLANDLVITDIGAGQQSPQTYTGGGAGWTNLASDMSIEGFASDYSLSLPAGAAASETVTVSNTTEWASTIAAFKPAGGGGGGAGAVLDPGFYYFNGWDGVGFSGGGICLNGGTLLAQTTTLEFVNKAGFSSGDCTVGGGATACSSPCQFGSNSVADSTFTYFSAPCSQAPAGDSSCAGPGWCTNGDRACLNVLIWSSSTGQIAIKGPNAQHWLLGSLYWPGTCTDTVNGTSTIAGTLSCGTLSISAAAGAGTAIGGNYGIGTSLVEAILVE